MSKELEHQLGNLLSDHWQKPVEITGLKRLTAGASAQTWRFDANEQALILRLGQKDEQMPLMLTKTEEAKFVSSVHGAGLPAPEVLLILTPEMELGQGFIMRRLEGETLPQKILALPELENARQQLTAQCGRFLASLHDLPVAEVNYLPRSTNQQYLKKFYDFHQSFGEPLAAFELAFACLRECLQEPPKQTLVHGDFRNGNLMVNKQGLHAVFDWELSHIGDPLEDLAWLCVNSWRFGRRDKQVGGFGQLDALLEAYQAVGGGALDREQLRLWELFGVLRWGIIIQYQYDVHRRGVERSLERIAIGRRLSECELDIAVLVEKICG